MQATAQDFTQRRLRIDERSSPAETEWFHDVYRRDVVKVDLAPHSDAPFVFDTTIRVLPDLGVSRTFFSPMLSRRRKQDDTDALMFAVVLSGNATLLHAGQEVPLLAGAATSARYDAADADAALDIRAGTTVLGLRLSRRLIEPLIPDYENLTRQVLPAGGEALGLLIAYLDMLDAAEAISTPEAQRLVAHHVHDLAALAIGCSRDGAELAAGRSVRAARLAAIKQDVLHQLADPNLSVAAVAARQGVTPRYLHMLFEAEGVTFSEYVVGQRLARTHRMLCDPRFAELTITAIALQAGFGDLSYFNRTFRARFGATPREVRALARRNCD